jgi:hypothetical protein
MLHVFTPGSRVNYDASVNSKSIHVASNKPCLCYTHTEATSKPQVRYLVHTEDVREYCFIYFRPHQIRHASRCNSSTSTMSCTTTTRVWPQRLYINYVVHHRLTSHQSVALALAVCPVIPLCVVTTRLAAATDILRLRRASGCLGTSRGSSRGSSRRSSSTTPPRAGSSSTTPRHAGSSLTTSPPPRVRVPRHVARLVMPLVALLVVDYSASHRLVIDYSASAAHPGASSCRTACHEARRAARR